MKKILLLLIVGILVLNGLVVAKKNSDIREFDSNSIGGRLDYTHTTLVEAGTATWCEPCATAAAVMHDIYCSGNYDFSYVALVFDKNPYAHARTNELNVFTIPDYVFDGGFTRYVGTDNLPEEYITRLDQCGARNVADIDFDLQATWLGNAKIDVTLNIINNESAIYNGHLHVYVTEIESRWNTYSGQPYHFAMIGNYAFNTKVNVPAGGISQYSTTWDGNKYGFSDIEKDNIMVIATVFDSGTKYVDETAAVTPIEKPILYIQPLTGGMFRVGAEINNSGTINATGLIWSIKLNGSILLGKNTTGGPENIPAGGSKTIYSKPIFGFGPTAVTIEARIPDGSSAIRKQITFVLLFYIFIKPDMSR